LKFIYTLKKLECNSTLLPHLSMLIYYS